MITKGLLAALLAAAAMAPALAAPPQAKKVWRDAMVGHHVPPNATYAVPSHLRATLPRPPRGYRYAIVNDQVVLVSGSNVVVDIIRDIVS
jgi:hypothetical protein